MDKLTREEFEKMVKDLKQLKVMASELDAEITAIEDTLKADMGDEEVRYTSDSVVRYTKTHQSRFNTKAFKEEHGDMYNLYVNETCGRRFSVS